MNKLYSFYKVYISCIDFDYLIKIKYLVKDCIFLCLIIDFKIIGF